MKLQKSEIKSMVDIPSLQASEVKQNSKIQLVKRDSEDFAKEVDTKFGRKLLLTCTWNTKIEYGLSIRPLKTI